MGIGSILSLKMYFPKWVTFNNHLAYPKTIIRAVSVNFLTIIIVTVKYNEIMKYTYANAHS